MKALYLSRRESAASKLVAGGSEMFYVIFIVGLLMVCVAALEFCYMMFLESVVRQHKRRIVELERENAELARQLETLETLLDDEEIETEDEAWPEVVDEDNRRF
ncbi:MAG TPA: hypothetical protein VGB73_17000 [Pyrinomonadaceae bacterium]